RKQVTVLFADMVDSMRIAERLDAEEWHRLLDRFFQILAEGIHRFEGTIDQFTGDGVMALFGAPVAHEDHARRCCHAALYLMDALRSYADGLRSRGLEVAVRMGLNSGEVVVGRIGDDLRMDYTAQGHSVGLAARMEQVAAPGSVYVSEHTARLVEGFFTLRDCGTPAMKGVSTPVRVFELLGVGPLRTRLDAPSAQGFSRRVGRGGCGGLVGGGGAGGRGRLARRHPRPRARVEWTGGGRGGGSRGREEPGLPRVRQSVPRARHRRPRGPLPGARGDRSPAS